MPLNRDETLGWFGDLTVKRAPANSSALMELEIADALPSGETFRASEPLDRADIERLRDLCDEALA